MSLPFPDYDPLAVQFRDAGLDMLPSEAQGVLLGMLCASSDTRFQSWVEDVCPADAFASPEDQKALWTALAPLHVLSLQALQQEAVQLLLPNDDAPLSVRAPAVAAWSHGFLYGLARSGLDDTVLKDAVLREALDTVLEVTRVDLDQLDDEDGADFSMMEIEEFLRTAVILCRDVLQAGRDVQ